MQGGNIHNGMKYLAECVDQFGFRVGWCSLITFEWCRQFVQVHKANNGAVRRGFVDT